VIAFMAMLIWWVLFGQKNDDSIAARLVGLIWPAIGLAASVFTFIAMTRERARATAAPHAPVPSSLSWDR
jgi:hypothetical protein